MGQERGHKQSIHIKFTWKQDIHPSLGSWMLLSLLSSPCHSTHFHYLPDPKGTRIVNLNILKFILVSIDQEHMNLLCIPSKTPIFVGQLIWFSVDASNFFLKLNESGQAKTIYSIHLELLSSLLSSPSLRCDCLRCGQILENWIYRSWVKINWYCASMCN